MTSLKNAVSQSAIQLIARDDLDRLYRAPRPAVRRLFSKKSFILCTEQMIYGLLFLGKDRYRPAWVRDGKLSTANVEVENEFQCPRILQGKSMLVFAGDGRELLNVPLDGSPPVTIFDTGSPGANGIAPLIDGMLAICGQDGAVSGALRVVTWNGERVLSCVRLPWKGVEEIRPLLGGKAMMISDRSKRVAIIGVSGGAFKLLADFELEDGFLSRTLDDSGQCSWFPEEPFIWGLADGSEFEVTGIEEAWQAAFSGDSNTYPTIETSSLSDEVTVPLAAHPAPAPVEPSTDLDPPGELSEYARALVNSLQESPKRPCPASEILELLDPSMDDGFLAFLHALATHDARFFSLGEWRLIDSPELVTTGPLLGSAEKAIWFGTSPGGDAFVYRFGANEDALIVRVSHEDGSDQDEFDDWETFLEAQVEEARNCEDELPEPFAEIVHMDES